MDYDADEAKKRLPFQPCNALDDFPCQNKDNIVSNLKCILTKLKNLSLSKLKSICENFDISSFYIQQALLKGLRDSSISFGKLGYCQMDVSLYFVIHRGLDLSNGQ